MKLIALSLSLGVAALAAISAPASAADWNYGAGSIKDSIPAAVPVPAPVPVPEYSRYYFRLDAGFGTGDAPDSSEEGLVLGEDSVTGPFATRPAWLNDDFDTFVTLGAGVGMYFGNFRADFTAETRTEDEVEIDGRYQFTSVVDPVAVTEEEVTGTVRDKTSLSGGIFLFNGYYDFNRIGGSRFTPYLGGGIGFAWNELKRVHTTHEISRTCGAIAPRTCGTASRRDLVQVQDKTHDITFAATATAGLAYRLSDYALIDVNYRYLFVDATDVGIRINGDNFGGNSRLSIGEMHEHQIRAGLRFDVN